MIVVASGAMTSADATSPTAYRTLVVGRMSAARIAVSAATSAIAAIVSRVASLRVKRARTGARWVSIGSPSRTSVGPAVVRHEIGTGQRTRDATADDLAVGAAAGPRGEPAHHLAEITGAGGARGRDPLVDEGVDLGLRQCLGQVVAEDVDLRLLLGGKVRAATLLVRLDGLASGLDLARQDREELVLGQRPLVRLLEVVGGVRDHAQDVTTQRVATAHGGGDVGLDSFSKGHRSWLPRAVVALARGAAGS